MTNKSEIIAKLNDQVRKNLFDWRSNHKIVMTPGVYKEPFSNAILNAVKDFDDFNESNDPYKEHDFGQFYVNNMKYFWKIDYYDNSMKYGSEDPSNPKITKRLLTIMRADEY